MRKPLIDPKPNCVLSVWNGAYDESWGRLIHHEAYAHPAKFSYGLILRIVRHGLERGYWKRGQLIGDPFGGVALGGIVCGANGLNWLGVELESEANGGSPFVELGRKNLERNRHLFDEGAFVEIVQGDSRRFHEIVRECCGVVTSPPYADSVNAQQHGIDWTKAGPATGNRKRGEGTQHEETLRAQLQYGHSPGQIGSLKAGTVDGAILSPPYADGLGHGGTPTRGGGRGTDTNLDGMQNSYGTTDGQIGALKAGSVDGAIEPVEGVVDGICTSPPWENNCEGGFRAGKFKDADAYVEVHSVGGSRGKGHGCSVEAARRKLERDENKTYGESNGQIGTTKGESYWVAVKTVYASMHAAMKPGAVAAIVVKSFVSKGKIVDLPSDTCRLLESLGFKVFERTRAMLVKESRQPGLFGGEIAERTERKSFFRRLAEKKGSPSIDWEEVIWARKPLIPNRVSDTVI